MTCKSAYSKYNNELTKTKENTTTTKNNENMKAVFEQITEFELQKIPLKSCNEKTEKDADKYSKDPEGKKDIQLLGTDNKL